MRRGAAPLRQASGRDSQQPSGAGGGAAVALLLAAGRSSRMGRNKLLIEDAAGRSMVARTLGHLLGSGVRRPVHVVVGHEAPLLRAALLRTASTDDVRVVEARDHAEGLSASLRAGLASLPEDATAVLVCLGDMPLVGAPVIDSLLAAFDPEAGRSVVVPTAGGVRGNPVLWGRRHIPALLVLTGDAGARRLFEALAGELREVETDDTAVLRDFDTPEALAAMPA